MHMTTDPQTLINAIGEYTIGMFNRSTFRHLSATLDESTGEVVFDAELVRNTRRERHEFIDTVLNHVRPVFAPEDVSFTFTFSEGASSLVGSESRPAVAVV